MNQYSHRQTRPAQQGAQSAAGGSAPKQGKKSKFMLGKNVAALFLLVAGSILALATVALLVTSDTAADRENERLYEEGYQAVFLDSQDSQIYFGLLTSLDDDTYRLNDIYYVRVQTAVQPETGQTQATGVSLAKLGNEIHGPQDTMYINKDQVLYWENLKDTGQVVCAIRDYQINTLNMSDVTRHEDCPDDSNSSVQQSNQQQGAGAANGTQPVGSPNAGANDTPGDTTDTPTNP